MLLANVDLWDQKRPLKITPTPTPTNKSQTWELQFAVTSHVEFNKFATEKHCSTKYEYEVLVRFHSVMGSYYLSYMDLILSRIDITCRPLIYL